MTQICMSVKSSQNKLLGKIFSDKIMKLIKLDNETPMTNKEKYTQYSTMPTDHQSFQNLG